MKIYDCFTWYNEFHVLNLRLHELAEVVDQFVLVEANQTHTGRPKSLGFANVAHHFKQFPIRVVQVKDFPETQDAWVRERFQRNAIMRGLTDAVDGDMVTVCDADEIPDPERLKDLRGPGYFEQDMYYYNLRTRMRGKWGHPKAAPYGYLQQIGGPEKLRFASVPRIERGGWHLSYFGSPAWIQNKLLSFAHTEYAGTTGIEDRVKNQEDLFLRGIQFDKVPVEGYLPKHYTLLPEVLR